MRRKELQVCFRIRDVLAFNGITTLNQNLKGLSKKMLSGLFMLILTFTTLTAFSQQSTISGTVKDASTGESLLGVSIVVKGTTSGTVTDLDGNFTMAVDASDTLQFSYVGYLQENVAVGSQTVINIDLSPDVETLEEIVVIGYGTMKKSDLTGAITSLDEDEIAENKGANALAVMQGKVAGLDITESSGESGGSVSLTLRGLRSINAGNSPLILVDGVEYGSTLDINPSDIESMEILKDASSTAIYGTRGANGVILITTKSGSNDGGKAQVYFNSYMSYNTPTNVPNVMTGVQFAQKRFETKVADSENKMWRGLDVELVTDDDGKITGITWDTDELAELTETSSQASNHEDEDYNYTIENVWDVFGSINVSSDTSLMKVLDLDLDESTSKYEYISTDSAYLHWMENGMNNDYIGDYILTNSITDNYEFGITGGSKNTAANFSLGLMNDRGLMEGDKLKRYNAKLGVDQTVIEDMLTIGGDILYTYKVQDKRNSGIYNQALKTGSIGDLYDENGDIISLPCVYTNDSPNPLLDQEEGAYVRDIQTNRLFGSAYLNFTPVAGLVFNSSLSLSNYNQQNAVYAGPTSLTRVAVGTASTTMQHTKNYSLTWSNTLSYAKSFGMHEINVMVGNEINKNEKQYYSMVGTGQAIAATEYYDWTQGNFTEVTTSSSYTATQLLSEFGRLMYKFQDKYIIQGTLRADGSSVLVGETNLEKTDYFPSVSAGWKISEESFMNSINAISNLKLRASWGISGTASIDAYSSQTTVSDDYAYYTFDGETFQSTIPYQLGPEDLGWETTRTIDIGLDFGLYRNRITGSIDVYDANTTDLLIDTDLPPTSTYTQVISNAAASHNKGIELYLSTRNISKNDLTWTTDFTFSMNRGEVTQTLNDAAIVGDDYVYAVGEPVSNYYGYEYLGIYSVEDLQDEIEYVQEQEAAGADIDSAMIPMLLNDFYPGDVKLNLGDNGVLDADDKITYDRSPKFLASISNYWEYKGVGLKIMVLARLGQTINYSFYSSYKSADNVRENGPYVDAWTPTNTDAYFPRYATSGNSTNTTYTDALCYLDGSFIKIKDITLSYTLPQSLMDKIGFTSIRIYATGKNLLTFSRIDNYDPERGGSMSFPLKKQYIAGVNIQF